MAAIFELHDPTTTSPVSATARSSVPRRGTPSPPPQVRLSRAPSTTPARERTAPSNPRRAVAALGALLAVVAVGMLGWSVLRGASPALADVEASGEYHVVSEGDTLYSVAEGWDPAASVASTIDRIEDLNGGPLSLVPGDVIALPLPVQ